MNKDEFKREYRKWRMVKRGISNTYHGQRDGYYEYEISDATSMLWDFFRSNAPFVVKYAIDNKLGGNSQAVYRELNSRLGRTMFKVNCQLNMELPPSFRRQLEKQNETNQITANQPSHWP